MYKAGRYRQDIWWWDSEDNEYLLEGTFKYYEPEPDVNFIGEGVLVGLELIDKDSDNAPDISNLLGKDGDVWRSVEDDFDLRHAICIDDDWF